MKNDYLWDKSGESDPEIERLESMLKTFRGKQVELPALPFRAIRAKQNFYQTQHLRFAFVCAAVCLAVGGTIFTVWTITANRQPQIAVNTVESSETTNNKSLLPDNLQTVEPLKIARQNRELVYQARRRKISRSKNKLSRDASVRTIRLSNSMKATRNDLALREQEFNNRVRLTAEERYAYKQLMRALQITSSQLNRVKQKIQNANQEKNSLHS